MRFTPVEAVVLQAHTPQFCIQEYIDGKRYRLQSMAERRYGVKSEIDNKNRGWYEGVKTDSVNLHHDSF